MAMVIEGESLLNDGAAIVLFNVFLKLATTETGISGRNNLKRQNCIYLVFLCFIIIAKKYYTLYYYTLYIYAICY